MTDTTKTVWILLDDAELAAEMLQESINPVRDEAGERIADCIAAQYPRRTGELTPSRQLRDRLSALEDQVNMIAADVARVDEERGADIVEIGKRLDEIEQKSDNALSTAPETRSVTVWASSAGLDVLANGALPTFANRRSNEYHPHLVTITFPAKGG